MYLVINGDLNKYYMQTLCMLFFPGATFSEDENDAALQQAEFTRIDKPDGGVTVRVRFKNGSGEASAERDGYPSDLHRLDEGGLDMGQRCARAAAGRAAIDAGMQLFGCRPAWGILTGIRPAKFAADLLGATDADGARLYNPARVREILGSEYLVTPKKAALAVDIAKAEQKIVRLADDARQPTCSIYISVPFCPTRCSYCSFVSYATKKLLALIPEYLERLCADLTDLLAYIRERKFKVLTVYIGGGTPTTLNEWQLYKLLETLNEGLAVNRLHEFTLEGGRPDTITRQKLDTAASMGVTRMSINPQTMNDEILRGIGRRHTVRQFIDAYTMAREAGIGAINTDLIAGLPGDDFAGFARSLDGVMALDPDNITVHTFCVKKSAEILRLDTEIYSRSAEETVKAVDYAQVTLNNGGYHPYYIYRQKNTVGNLENVGYAKKGTDGLYNVLMMEELHTIFAVGAGAVTKFVRTDSAGKKHIDRIFEPKYPFEYLKQDREAAMRAKTERCDAFFAEEKEV